MARSALLVLVVAALAGCSDVSGQAASGELTSPPPSTSAPTATPTVRTAESVAPTAATMPSATGAAATTARTSQPATPAPRATTPPPQPATARPGAYTTLPPGSALPSDAQCAAGVGTDPWEPRPDNQVANHTNVWAQGFRLSGSYLAQIAPGYQERVTGNFTGTTDQILRWAACKWGFDEQDVRAQAVIEGYWHQSTLGDCGGTTQPQTRGCASVGILQVKGADIPATHPGTYPAAMTSTAFNVDYALAVRRLCFDGRETWMRQFNASYAAGDVWGCIGRWFSGRWHDAAAEQYIAKVKSTLAARTWLTPNF